MADAGYFAARTWPYRSGRFRAFSHDFGIRADHPRAGRWISRLMARFAVPGDPPSWYSLERAPLDRWRLSFGNEVLREAVSLDLAVEVLLWHVNQLATQLTEDLIVVHAAGVTAGDVGVLLPAAPEAGKTTLTAGLVERGLGYLSDEAVGVDPIDLALHAYPTPLVLKRGSWAVLPGLEPRDPWFARDRWHVPVEAIRDGAAVQRPVAPRLIVQPQYAVGGGTALVRISGGRALLQVAQQTFRLNEDPDRILPVLAALVRRCDCYVLTVGDLDAACSDVLALLETVRD